MRQCDGSMNYATQHLSRCVVIIRGGQRALRTHHKREASRMEAESQGKESLGLDVLPRRGQDSPEMLPRGVGSNPSVPYT